MTTPTWVTSEGLVGVYPATIAMQLQLITIPSIGVTFSLISGELPAGLLFRSDGKIYGTPESVTSDTTSTFTVRATETISGDLKDRTFSIKVIGNSIPKFITPNGSLTTTLDSKWVEIPIEYSNPIADNPIYIRVVTGVLPPGLEINEYGLIRGYPLPPLTLKNLPGSTSVALATDATTNYVTVLGTNNMNPGRPLIFSGTVFGNIVSGQTYFVRKIVNSTQIELCTTPNGSVFPLSTASGFMDVTLSPVQLGQPTKRQYSFTLEISSPLGKSNSTYTITVINHYLPSSEGGPTPSNPANTRKPTIYNTRPPTYNIDVDPDYGYYLLPTYDELTEVNTIALATNTLNGYITVVSTANMYVGRVIIFTGTSFGNIVSGNIYYIKTIINGTHIQISEKSFGDVFVLTTATGIMNVNVPVTSGMTYQPSQKAYMGQYLSGEYFAFKIIGHDFDDGSLTYNFSSLPAGLTGDSATGWVYGTPTVSLNDIQEYDFNVYVAKTINPSIVSDTFNYSFKIANSVGGDIIWLTDSDLGIIDNATICYKVVEATCDVPLIYELVGGELPPNLVLQENGELRGTVAYQPTDTYKEQNDTETFTFTIRAYNEDIAVVTSNKVFTLTVLQQDNIPTDSLYIKCTPTSEDRQIIRSLLTDTSLIPTSYLFRPEDANFGKATSVIYGHAYGIYTSTLQQYIEAIQKNHYWRNVTLGELKTAVAKDDNGNIIYEVVYSSVIDNLQNYDPNYNYDYRYSKSVNFSESVSEQIKWPYFIPLNTELYTVSSTDIYTSYVFANDLDTQMITNLKAYDVLSQTGLYMLTQQGTSEFYTSVTSGYARILYPASLYNMRERLEQELGANYNFKLLPLWMTSQQADGNTLGFTPAWVICYTKPAVKIEVTATQTFYEENTILVTSTDGIELGGIITFENVSFSNLVSNISYYVISVNTSTNKIQVSTTANGQVYRLTNDSGVMTGIYDPISYAEIIKTKILDDWPYTLNKINFQIDRFTVNKQLTYDYNSETFNPSAWTRYPSATPVPSPIDSQDFYVIFPQKTILPNSSQYDL